MPLNLAKLVANRATASIDFGGGDVLHVEYYPARITSEMLAKIASLSHPESLSEEQSIQALDSAAGILAEIGAGWDLVEGEEGAESPVPFDAEHLAALGITLQWQILNGVMSAQAGSGPDAKSGAPTGRG